MPLNNPFVVENLSVLGAIQFSDQSIQSSSNVNLTDRVLGITRDALNGITSINTDKLIVEKTISVNEKITTPNVLLQNATFTNDIDQYGFPVIQSKGFSNELRNNLLDAKDKIASIIPDILEPPLKKAKLNVAEFETTDFKTTVSDSAVNLENLNTDDRTVIQTNYVKLQDEPGKFGAMYFASSPTNAFVISSSSGQINFNGNNLLGIGQISGTASDAEKVKCTEDDTNGTYFLPFIKTPSDQSKELFMKTTGASLSYNPSTSTLAATNFSGIATSANELLCTSDNTSGSYFIPFTKINGTGNKTCFIDDVTGPLTYNPATSTVTATNFDGTASNANNLFCTSDNSSGAYFVLFTKTSGTGNKQCFIDPSTTPFTYNPWTSTLTASNFAGTATNATNAINVNVVASNTTDANYCVNFSSASGNTPIRSASAFTFNPSTNLLSVPGNISTTGNISSSGTISSTGNIISSGDVSGLSVSATLGVNTGLIINPSGNIRLQSNSASGLLDLNGSNFTTTSSGSASGDHLKVRVNGTDYVIELKNP